MKGFGAIAGLVCLWSGGAVTSGGEVQTCDLGPWGTLEYYFTYLEAPEHIMELVDTPSEHTVWQFPDKDLTALRAFFTEAGLPHEAQLEVFRESVPFHESPPYRYFPPAGVVLGMSPQTRQAIYAELRKWPQNRAYHAPLFIESGNVQSFFATSDLDAETLAKMERLCYRIGDTLAFSDLPLLLNDGLGDLGERALLKALTRTRSLIVRLRIEDTTDREALKDYWTAGFRQKDILPIFDSVAATPGVNYMDVAHLLPPTARKYLYTFPAFSMGVDGAFPDSFWTALNFFNYVPREDYLDREIALADLQATHVRAEPPYQFGDVILLRNATTTVPVQAAVYVAEEIVYTKNGRSLKSPFILTRFEDLLVRHLGEEKPTLEIWRRP